MSAPRRARASTWTEGPWALFFLLALDLLALFDACALGYLLRFQWPLLPQPRVAPAPVDEYLAAWGIVAYAAVALFHAYGIYELGKRRTAIDVLRKLVSAGGWVLLLVLSLSYFYRDFSYSRLALAYTALLALFFLALFRTAWESYRGHLRATRACVKRVVLVGSRTIPRFLAQRLREEPRHGYEIAAVADQGLIDERAFGGVPTGTLDDLPRLVEEAQAEEVLVGHPALGQQALLAIIETCERRRIPIRMVPATYDLLIDGSDFEEVDGIPLVRINEQRARPAHRVSKRIFDVACAAVLLVLSAPLLAALAVAIRIDSPGAAIFRQLRVGRNGRPFRVCKLRTMVQRAEQLLPALVDVARLPEPVFKLDDDPRVTRVGRVLRRWSLDELPQLWNVLAGDMSLVGPRPEEESMVARYDIWERRRLKLTPGITGLQQVHCRGSRSLKERVRWDILYLRKESFLLDLWILFRTVIVVLRGEGRH